MKRIKISAIIVACSVLISSCATVFSGRYQNVKIVASDPEAIIKVDNDFDLKGSGTVKLKRKDDHYLTINHPDFVKKEITIKKKVNPWVWGDLILAPVGLIGGLYFLQQGDPDAISLTTEESIGIGLVSSFYILPVFPFLVDRATGAANKFDRTIEVDTRRLPKKFDPETSLGIIVESINIKIQPGTKIGSFKNKKGKPYSDIKWENTLNVSYTDLVIQANNELNNLGLNVPGLRNLNEEMVRMGKESYEIEADIKSIEYNNNTVVPLREYLTTCELETTWRVVEPKTKAVKFHKTIVSKGEAQTNGGVLPVYEALRHSLYDLVVEPEFIELVSKSGDANKTSASTGNPTSLEILTGAGLADKAKLSVAEVAAKAKDAVVTVLNPTGHGSGFLISEDGYILSNAHVVEGFDNIEVKMSNGLGFEPELITMDVEHDLALLKIPGKGYVHLELTSEAPALGSDIMVIGTPAREDLSQSITRGVVSGNRLIEGKAMIQTDAGISPGNSGGPMLNMYGQAIGVVTSKLVGNGVEGVGFAIPSALVTEKLGLKNRKD